MIHQLSQIQFSDLWLNFFEQTKEKIFIFSRDGKVLAMNNAAKKILHDDVFEQMLAGKQDAICMTCKGYTSEEELQTCTNCYISSPKKDVGSFQVYLDTVDDGVTPFTASFQTVDIASGIRILMLRDLSKQIRTQEMVYQKLQMNRVLKAQEDERKRISRELHDSVSQEMLSLLVDIRVMKYMTSNDAVVQKVREAEGTLMRLLEDIQRLSVELRPATLDDLGIVSAFRAHFKTIEKNYGILVHFSSNIGTKRYEGEIETAIYRICQEAVLNAVKYADVDELNVTLSEDGGVLTLHVQDNGRGFHVERVEPQGTGLGLYGMRERAELINGQLSIQSAEGKGTDVTLEISLEKGGF